MLTCSTQLSNYLSRIVDDTPIIIFFSKRKRSTKIFSLLNEFVYRFKFLSTYQNINFSRKLIQIHRRYAIPPRKNSLSSLIRKLEKNGKIILTFVLYSREFRARIWSPVLLVRTIARHDYPKFDPYTCV